MAPHLFLRFVSSIRQVLDCTWTAHMYNLSDRVEHKVQGDTERAGAGQARRATGNKLVSYIWRNTTKQNLHTFQSYNYDDLSDVTSQLYSTPWLEETWSKLTFQMCRKQFCTSLQVLVVHVAWFHGDKQSLPSLPIHNPHPHTQVMAAWCLHRQLCSGSYLSVTPFSWPTCWYPSNRAIHQLPHWAPGHRDM